MARTTTTVEDPDMVATKNVDNGGRVYLGKDFRGTEVRIVVERLTESENSDDEPNPVNPDDPLFDRTTFETGDPSDTSENVDYYVAKAAYEDSHGEGSWNE